jgi:hypothetical protein
MFTKMPSMKSMNFYCVLKDEIRKGIIPKIVFIFIFKKNKIEIGK